MKKQINYEQLNKLYYSISEVADLFDVNASLIRFWEKEFKLLKPKKNAKGNRQFTVKDIANIDKVYTLVKEKGFTLEGAKKAMRSKDVLDEIVVQSPLDNEPDDIILRKLERIKADLMRLKS